MSDLLGIPENELHGRHLRSLIAPGDQNTYDVVQDRRAKGLHVDPYPIHLQGANGPTSELWIVSAAVPTFDEVANTTLPQTFGIILQHKPRTRLTVMEPNKKVG
jgi:hypothetical protein